MDVAPGMDLAPQISPRCFAPKLVLGNCSGASRTRVIQQGSVQVHPDVGITA